MQNVNDLLVDRPSPRNHGNIRRSLNQLIQHDANTGMHEDSHRPDDAVVRHDRSERSSKHAHTKVMSMIQQEGVALVEFWRDTHVVTHRSCGYVRVWTACEELFDFVRS